MTINPDIRETQSQEELEAKYPLDKFKQNVCKVTAAIMKLRKNLPEELKDKNIWMPGIMLAAATDAILENEGRIRTHQKLQTAFKVAEETILECALDMKLEELKEAVKRMKEGRDGKGS